MAIFNDVRNHAVEKLVPLQATLELTYRCNERCGHCYLSTYDDHAAGKTPLTLSEWKRILDELAQAGAFVLILTGGEAMMHPHFWEIASKAADNHFAITLITNGLLMNENAADKICELGFYQVTFSVYSLNPAIHDKMTRRRASHLQCMQAIERLLKRKVGVGINCLLTKDNIETYFELESWARTHGINIQFDPMITPKTDGSLAPTLLRATPNQLIKFYRKLKEKGQKIRPVISENIDDPVCIQGRGKCAVTTHGDLLSCLEVRNSIGNLREKSFQELWNSPKAWHLRQNKTRDLKFNATCGDGSFCDHCPGVAVAETGDQLAPVPFLMDIARIKRQISEES